MPSMESQPKPIFLNSEPVKTENEFILNGFTALPVRISKYDDVAEAAARRLDQDWAMSMKDGAESKTSHTSSPVGNLSSYLFPESLPDRLGVISYINEIAFLHDEKTENMPHKEAQEEHDNLGIAMSVDENTPIATSKTAALKRVLSKALLECLNIDHEAGLEIIDGYRKKWLVESEIASPHTIFDLDEFIRLRRANAGIDAFWSMMAYSHGTRFKSEDYEMMKVLTDIAEKTMLFTNDYYSWAKEKICNNGRIMNVIDFFMRTEGMTECEALNKAKVCIVELEQTFLTAREDFYRSNPNLPVHIHKWAEVLGLVIAGYHYHCANFPRYDSVEIQNDRAYVEQNEVIANGGPKEKIQSEMTPTRQKSKNSNIGSFEPRNVLGPPNLLHFNDVENSDCLCTPEKPQQAIAKLDTSALTAPVQYIKSMSSKNVRSQLIDAFNVWFEVDSSTMATIKQVINDLHTSSLILDDIEDQSQLRRGGTTAHLVFGTAQSINSATHLFVRVSQMVYRLNKPALLDVLFEELETLFIGQSWDLSWRYESYCPTETEYLAMIDKKTGAMFRMLLRLMEVTTSRYSIQKFDSLITLLGRWFQIRDDYMNLQGVEYSKQKGFCEDLNEGKLSFPVVKCCDSSPINRKIILGIFRQNQYGSLPAESKSQILKLMKESGALMFTWKYIQTLESEVDSEIKYIETMTGEVNPTLRLLFKMLGNVPSPKQALQAADTGWRYWLAMEDLDGGAK